MHRTSSPVPPGVLLSTIIVPPSNALGGGPLSHHNSRNSPSSSSPNATTTGHTNTSPPPPEGFGNNNFSLTSSRAGGAGATFNSWDVTGDALNLTFSQVSPSTGRLYFLVESDRVFPFHDADGNPTKEDSPPLTNASPRKRGEAAVTFAAFDCGSNAMESRLQVGFDGAEHPSVSWHPQGLFGAALERFVARDASSSVSAVTSSMGGTVLGSEVPEDLPPENLSVDLPRRLSGPSVHAIQFDTDFGGNVTPFMSITSPGVSRRSISTTRLSVPQLSVGSSQLSEHAFERDGATQGMTNTTVSVGMTAVADDEASEQRLSLLPSSVASPVFNNDTVPAAHFEPPRSTRSERTFSSHIDSDRAQLPSLPMSPERETVHRKTWRSFRRTGTSVGSRVTIDLAPIAIGEDDNGGATPHDCDIFMGAESATRPFQSAMVASPLTTNSSTGIFESLPNPCTVFPSLEVPQARANIECTQAAEFTKLRSLLVSESLARARSYKTAQWGSSKYASNTLLRQPESEEKEQLQSPMRGRMCAAEVAHQHIMQELREKERKNPILLPLQPPLLLTDEERLFAGAASSRRRDSDTQAGSRRGTGSLLFQKALLETAPPLPPLPPLQLSSELRFSTQHPPANRSKDAEVEAEVRRQRASPCSNSFEKLV